MLDYQNAALLDILHDDGLLIMAKGLGIEHIILNVLKVHCEPGNLVLVIGANPKEEHFFIDQLESDHVKPLPKSITADCGAGERYAIYLQGGVLFVTTRILVVDMLKNTAPIESITGIIVLKAHKVRDSCQEAFILRLFREKNKDGFIKGFSSHPDAFTRGFCKVEKVMRSLFVKKLYLWPRFHANVNASLECHKGNVTEVQISLTKLMLAIQTSLLDLIAVCVRELKSCNPMLDLEEVDVDNASSKAFDKIIRYQLEPVWHQLSSKTIRLINDLKELRTILIHLTQYDCMSFYNVVESLKTSDKVMRNPGWIFLPAAESLFLHSKERVFGHSRRSKNEVAQASNVAVPADNLLLEETPKWIALREIVSEVLAEIKSLDEPLSANRILIVANDSHTCDQIKEILSDGNRKLLLRLYDVYLNSKGLTQQAPRKKTMKKSAEKGISNKESNNNGIITLTQIIDRNNGGELESKKITTEDKPALQPVSEPMIIIEPVRETGYSFTILQSLEEFKPRFIIMYDIDMTFVRQMEVYKATHPNFDIKVYIMVYEGSSEEQRYLNILRREKEAFEVLIQQKGNMVIPEERDGKVEGHPDLDRDPRKANETVNSSTSSSMRKGGGDKESQVKQKVIVDVREFRSELPSLIHRRGIDIEPVTLEVGDYILTPDICVERKSVNDLIGSLNSGRLYTQATAMCRYYKKPMLLIEFDLEKPFILQAKYGSSREFSSQDFTSKLLLLTLHFPRLKLLWCANPYVTAEIFEELKLGKQQPNAAEAMKVTEAVITDQGRDVNVDKYSPGPKDFLTLLPGVDTKNCWSLMNNVSSLTDLANNWSEERLSNLLCNSASSKSLWESLHIAPKQTVTDQHKPSKSKGISSKWKQKN